MDEIITQLETGSPQRLRRWLPRFRIATMLWLMVVLTAFFCGRRSEEFQISARKWWMVNRVRWGANVTRHEIIDWPPGSLTINAANPLQLTSVSDEEVATAALTAARQLRITPKADGKSKVSFIATGSPFPKCNFELEIENGRVADWTITGSP